MLSSDKSLDKNLTIALSAIVIVVLALSYQINQWLFIAEVLLGVLGASKWLWQKPSPSSPAPSSKTTKKNTTFTPITATDIDLGLLNFQDIHGLDEVKSTLEDIKQLLTYSHKSNQALRPPKGVLLIGKPGVGKTMIAKAFAKTCGMAFFYQSGSSFASRLVGSGAENIKQLFESAKAHAPAIVFIDEIDALGKSRGEGRNDERESTLNEMLTRLDGFESNSNIVVIGATNRPEVIDEALMRDGRFDVKITIELPNYNDRLHIIKGHLKGHRHNLDTEQLADFMMGYSGAKIANSINQAAIKAFKENATLSLEHFKDNTPYTKKERQVIALYQATKFTLAHALKLQTPQRIFLFGTFAIYQPQMPTVSHLKNQILVHLGAMHQVRTDHDDAFGIFRGDIQTINQLKNTISNLSLQPDTALCLNDLHRQSQDLCAKHSDQIQDMTQVLLEQEYWSL